MAYLGLPTLGYAADNAVVARPTVGNNVTRAQALPPVVRRNPAPAAIPRPAPAINKEAKPEAGREDYFVSSDTVIIGCTSGMAAGILVGSVPVSGAVMSGIGLPESINLLLNLAGMGCGVGAVSSAVAIFTAWMLAP